MRQIILLIIAALLLTIPGRVTGEGTTRGKGLNDPLLDKLVGDWNLERKFPGGRTAKNVVHVEWVLQHQFVELHYRDVVTPPAYEAIVLIGYDSVNKCYVCHWTDNFGADNSAEGLAPREEGSNAIEFTFTFHDGGELINRFAFDPKIIRWVSTIRQTEKGEWKTFCEDTFTRSNGK
jgi:hypothetical protein